MKSLGDFLKKVRENKKISVSRVASRLKVKEDYIVCVEDNNITNFSKKRLEDIVIAYDLNKDEENEFYKIAL